MVQWGPHFHLAGQTDVLDFNLVPSPYCAGKSGSHMFGYGARPRKTAFLFTELVFQQNSLEDPVPLRFMSENAYLSGHTLRVPSPI